MRIPLTASTGPPTTFECSKCGTFLCRYIENSAKATAIAAEAKRIVEQGFEQRRSSASAEEMKDRVIEIIDQMEQTLLATANLSRTNQMSIADVLQLLIGLRGQIRRIE